MCILQFNIIHITDEKYNIALIHLNNTYYCENDSSIVIHVLSFGLIKVYILFSLGSLTGIFCRLKKICSESLLTV